MQKILVYGDSNTWGDNFITGIRIDDEAQWPNILQKKLGENYKILQEGLPGRIAGDEEVEKNYKNGKSTFMSTFRISAPIDTLIISLGTNDLQIKYDKSSEKIINDLLWYEKILKTSFEDEEDRKKYFKNNKMPKIIYILPVNFDYKLRAQNILNNDSEKKRKEIIEFFSKSKYKFIVNNDMTLFEDGIHLNYDDHVKMANIVRGVLEDE